MGQREGLVGLTSLCALPQHLELCYNWSMMARSCNVDYGILAAGAISIETLTNQYGKILSSNSNNINSNSNHDYVFSDTAINNMSMGMGGGSSSGVLPSLLRQIGTVVKLFLALVTSTQAAPEAVAQLLNPSDTDKNNSTSSNNNGNNKEKKEKELHTLVLEGIYKTQLIRCMVDALRTYGSALPSDVIAILMVALCDLVLTSNRYMKQFTDAGGIESLSELGLFNGSSTSSTVSNNNNYHTDSENASPGSNINIESAGKSASSKSVDAISGCGITDSIVAALQISSHLARNSEKCYPQLVKLFTSDKFCMLLKHPSTIVRAKMCNLVGNLCRHNDLFYRILLMPVR